MADKAYSSRANRAWLRRHAIKAVIPVKEDQKKHRRDRGPYRRPPAGLRPGLVHQTQYRGALLQQAQAVPRRGHPLRQARAHIYQGTIDVASISIWLRDPVNDPRDTP